MYYRCKSSGINLNLMEHSHLIPIDQALSFLCAGNATFTFKSLKNNQRYTYQCLFQEKFDKEYIKVSYLYGPDNCSNYGYLCSIETKDGLPKITFVKSILKDSVVFRYFAHVFTCLLTDMELPLLEIWHEGKCARCGRKLTVPESIERGIGPECWGKANKFQIAI